MWWDNAPYHVGVGLYISSLTKRQIADLVCKCRIDEITFDYRDVDGALVQATSEVPVEGAD